MTSKFETFTALPSRQRSAVQQSGSQRDGGRPRGRTGAATGAIGRRSAGFGDGQQGPLESQWPMRGDRGCAVPLSVDFEALFECT